MLTASRRDDVVELGRAGFGAEGRYDAAVVSDRLPDGVRASVVITLPDTRGSGGTGTIRSGGLIEEISIEGAQQVVELLDEHLPHR